MDSKFDVNSVLEDAQKAVEEAGSSGGNGGYEHQILYPYQEGTLRVKLLYNPASSRVTRLLNRHRVKQGDETIKNPCLNRMYKDLKLECKTCKAISSIENATDTNLWRNSSARGISFAQYIDSDYKDQENMPEKGEIVILMYPYSVYVDINELITDAGENAENLVYRNEGRPIRIKRKQGNNRVDYKATIDTWEEFKSFEDEEEFIETLDNLPSLDEQIVPAEFKEEFKKVDREIASILEEKFLSDKVVVNEGKQKAEKFGQEKEEKVQTSNSSGEDEDRPECFGMYGSDEIDEDDCLICPHEPECADIS